MAIHWTELKTCDDDGCVMNLSEFIDDCLSGVSILGDITVKPDGSIKSWDQRYVFADGEQPSAESPAGDIDWTSFAARVDKAKSNELAKLPIVVLISGGLAGLEVPARGPIVSRFPTPHPGDVIRGKFPGVQVQFEGALK